MKIKGFILFKVDKSLTFENLIKKIRHLKPKVSEMEGQPYFCIKEYKWSFHKTGEIVLEGKILAEKRKPWQMYIIIKGLFGNKI